jgi:hypothetical protein
VFSQEETDTLRPRKKTGGYVDNEVKKEITMYKNFKDTEE